MRLLARNLRWTRTEPVGPDVLKHGDLVEATLFSIFKGFFTGLAVDFVAVLVALAIVHSIYPPKAPYYGYDSLIVVFDFVFLFGSPLIAVLGGLGAARLVRGGRAGILPIVLTWVMAALFTAAFFAVSEVFVGKLSTYGALLFLGPAITHGTLIGQFYWRRLAHWAPARFLHDREGARPDWHLLVAVLGGSLIWAIAVYATTFLTLM